MKAMPLWTAPWKRTAFTWHSEESRMFEDLFKEVSAKKVSYYALDVRGCQY